MRERGTVKSFRTKNGCGFIIDAEGGADVFVHVSNIEPNSGTPGDILVPGEEVEYDLEIARRGPAAFKVIRLNPIDLTLVSGTIKRCFDQRGYGFIDSSDGDVFFHYADTLFESPAPGEWVDYLLASIDGKPRALKVRRHKYEYRTLDQRRPEDLGRGTDSESSPPPSNSQDRLPDEGEGRQEELDT